jgi:hypothetical protein
MRRPTPRAGFSPPSPAASLGSPSHPRQGFAREFDAPLS